MMSTFTSLFACLLLQALLPVGIEDAEQEVRGLVDVLLDVSRILRAIPERPRLQQVVGELIVRDVDRHLRDDDDLQERISVLHHPDEFFAAQSARDLVIEDDHVVPVGFGPDQLEGRAPVRDHVRDLDPRGEQLDGVPHTGDVELFVFDQQDRNRGICAHDCPLIRIVNRHPPPGRFSASRSHPHFPTAI
jgi:hypothetical protein